MKPRAWIARSTARILTYLHAYVSTRRHRVRVPEDSGVSRRHPMRRAVHRRAFARNRPQLSAHGDGARIPSVTVPGIFDDLNRLGLSYRWVTRFIPLDRVAATSVLARYRRQWFAKRESVGAILKEVMFNEQAALIDTDADNKAADADAALRELGDDLVAFGYVTTTVTVADEDAHAAEENTGFRRLISCKASSPPNAHGRSWPRHSPTSSASNRHRPGQSPGLCARPRLDRNRHGPPLVGI